MITIYTNQTNSELLKEFSNADIFMPEVSMGFPLSANDVITSINRSFVLLIDQVDLSITTTSELVILWVLKNAPKKFDVIVKYVCKEEDCIYTIPLRTELEEEDDEISREFLDHWPNGFFDQRIDLIF